MQRHEDGIPDPHAKGGEPKTVMKWEQNRILRKRHEFRRFWRQAGDCPQGPSSLLISLTKSVKLAALWRLLFKETKPLHFLAKICIDLSQL
jgi:hypothetical protein